MEGRFDLVIVGGGMVGAAMALSLADTQLSIALLERALPESFSADQPMDLRVSALSPASIDLLDDLGAWQTILSWRACPYQRMRVWEMDEDAAGLAGLLTLRHPHPSPKHAYADRDKLAKKVWFAKRLDHPEGRSRQDLTRKRAGPWVDLR